jgi:hypothetical protein
MEQTHDTTSRRATAGSASTIGVAGGIDRSEASTGSMLWTGSTPGVVPARGPESVLPMSHRQIFQVRSEETQVDKINLR